MNRDDLWTPEQDAELAGLWTKKGFTGERIGIILGRTRSSILGRVRRLGLPYRHPVVARHGRTPKAGLSTSQRLASAPKRLPPDTRTLEQRLFGDPLPGRSALDQKKNARTVNAEVVD